MKIISIPIDKVTINMVVAKTIIGQDGQVLLYRDALLCEPTIKRLKHAEVSNVYVYEDSVNVEQLAQLETPKEPDKKDIKPALEHPKPTTIKTIPKPQEDVVPRILRTQTTNLVTNMFKNPKSVPFPQVVSTVSKIVDEILKNEKNVVPVENLRKYDNYTYEHCVNVCILGITLAKLLGYDKDELRLFGLGLLLHDFGKVKVPLEILNKPGKLNDYEFTVIKTHPQEGINELDKLYKLEQASKLVIISHHEKLNGRGYPRALRGDEIHQHARIATIVDVYDALTADRIYHSKRTPNEAVKILMKGVGEEFDTYLLQKFLTIIPLEQEAIPESKHESTPEPEPQFQMIQDWAVEVEQKKQEGHDILTEDEDKQQELLDECDNRIQLIELEEVQTKIVNPSKK